MTSVSSALILAGDKAYHYPTQSDSGRARIGRTLVSFPDGIERREVSPQLAPGFPNGNKAF